MSCLYDKMHTNLICETFLVIENKTNEDAQMVNEMNRALGHLCAHIG